MQPIQKLRIKKFVLKININQRNQIDKHNNIIHLCPSTFLLSHRKQFYEYKQYDCYFLTYLRQIKSPKKKQLSSANLIFFYIYKIMFREYIPISPKRELKRDLSHRIEAKSVIKEQENNTQEIARKEKAKSSNYLRLPKFIKAVPHQYISQTTFKIRKQAPRGFKTKDLIQVKQLTLGYDDYNKRIPLYSEHFCLRNKLVKKSLHVIVSITQRFYYITIEPKQSNIQYKLRLTLEVGQYIMDKIKKNQRKIYESNQNLSFKSKNYFRDKVYREKDQFNRAQYYLIIPWEISFRKYRFTRFQRKHQIDNTEEDRFLRQEIDKLGRQSGLFNKFEEKYFN